MEQFHNAKSNKYVIITSTIITSSIFILFPHFRIFYYIIFVFLIAVLTFSLYLILNKINLTKKYSWISTFLGVGYMLYFGISYLVAYINSI